MQPQEVLGACALLWAGAAGQMADQHRGGGAGDAGHVVVFGHPVAGEAERLGALGGGEGNGEGVGDAAAFADGHEVEHRKGDVF